MKSAYIQVHYLFIIDLWTQKESDSCKQKNKVMFAVYFNLETSISRELWQVRCLTFFTSQSHIRKEYHDAYKSKHVYQVQILKVGWLFLEDSWIIFKKIWWLIKAKIWGNSLGGKKPYTVEIGSSLTMKSP